MAKSRTRKSKPKGRVGRPPIVGPPLAPSGLPLLSLPPAVVADALACSPVPLVPHSPEDNRVACPRCGVLTKRRRCPVCDEKVEQPAWRATEDSPIREAAMKIIALRLGGLSDDQIAEHLGISRKSIGPYIYKAGKNGWLDYGSSREAIENGLAHKVIRNLNAFLDDMSDNDSRREVTLEVAKGTIFKEFGAELAAAIAPSTAISIRIEQPSIQQPIREGTIGGTVIDVTPDVPGKAS